jgi:large subunit ribosomal protein L29
MTTASDLRSLDDAGLARRVVESRREMFGLRFSHATGELENTSALRAAKRELARALTVARERDIDISTLRTTTDG